MPKNALSDIDRIALAARITLGPESLDMCYRIVNPTSSTSDEIFHKMALRWWNNPRSKAFRHDILNIRQQAAKDEIDMESDEDSPLTKSFLIKELRAALSATSDPADRASIALKLADLAGLKGKQEEKGEERRRFYLPFVSHCRTCKIMQLFREFQDKIEKK